MAWNTLDSAYFLTLAGSDRNHDRVAVLEGLFEVGAEPPPSLKSCFLRHTIKLEASAPGEILARYGCWHFKIVQWGAWEVKGQFPALPIDTIAQ